LYNNLDSCGDIHCALGQLKKEEMEGILLTPLRILQMHIHSGFYKSKTVDDNKK
jgi:hypothetical protein